jgi:hypothetical protein
VITTPERIMDAYDRIILAAGEAGMKVADARTELAELVAGEHAAWDVPTLPTLLRAYVENVVNNQRNARAWRRNTMFRACHDAVTGLTILGRDDPILDLAMRTGTVDGVDKATRHFQVEDWLDVLSASAQNTANAIEADQDLRALVNPIISAYARRAAQTFEDLL